MTNKDRRKVWILSEREYITEVCERNPCSYGPAVSYHNIYDWGPGKPLFGTLKEVLLFLGLRYHRKEVEPEDMVNWAKGNKQDYEFKLCRKRYRLIASSLINCAKEVKKFQNQLEKVVSS